MNIVTIELITSYTQVLFIFIIFRLNSVHSSLITQFKCQSRKRSLLAWQVRQDYCDDRITGCKGEIVWPATFSALFPINSGVPQGSVLGPLLYLLFTSDLPQEPNITTGTFADDTVILNCHSDVLRASSRLQEYLIILQRWLQKWKIKIISQSQHISLLRYEAIQAHHST
jgi:hypothetical protein